jgi:uncharacterized ferritin-like protein (DUF455 family)
MSFVDDLAARSQPRLAAIIDAGRAPAAGAYAQHHTALLQVALANEVSVAELAAAWVPSTPELDVKLAFARQAGDEAGHFQLLAGRLHAHGFDVDAFVPPSANPLFQYLATLDTTVDRVAAGLFTLEAIAYGVNENFLAYCRAHGDAETVRIYETIIQPEERAHQAIGRALLAKYAVTPASQDRVTATVDRVLEIATATRAAAATRLGITCVPGC